MNIKAFRRDEYQDEISKDVAHGTTETLHDIWVPQGCVLRLLSGSNSLNDPSVIGDVYWTVLVNGFEQDPYQKIKEVSNGLRQPLKPIEARGGDHLQIKATNGHASTDVKMGYDLAWEIVYLT